LQANQAYSDHSQESNSGAVLPTNLAAEREILGALVEDESLFAEAEAIDLRPVDFSFSGHRRIFEAILQLRAERCPVDFLTVAEKLGNGPAVVAMVADLITGCVLVRSHVRHHVKIVLRKSRLRQLARVGEWLEKTALTGDDPALISRMAAEKLTEVERRG
jgi:replicative DNA helicase